MKDLSINNELSLLREELLLLTQLHDSNYPTRESAHQLLQRIFAQWLDPSLACLTERSMTAEPQQNITGLREKQALLLEGKHALINELLLCYQRIAFSSDTMAANAVSKFDRLGELGSKLISAALEEITKGG